MSLSRVGFFGSRGLPSVAAPGGLVARLVAAVLGASGVIGVGCCSGADAAVLSAALLLVVGRAGSLLLSVFAAFGPSGLGSPGSCSASAVALVARAAAAVSSFSRPGRSSPVAVRWWAGGRGSLSSRLVGRSRALVSWVARGSGPGLLVGFVSPGRSPGSWGTVAAGVRAGLRVVVFPVGGALRWPSSLPGVGPVSWSPAASSGLWSRGSSPARLHPETHSPTSTDSSQPIQPGMAVDPSTGEIIPSSHPVSTPKDRRIAHLNYIREWVAGRTQPMPGNICGPIQSDDAAHELARFWHTLGHKGRTYRDGVRFIATHIRKATPNQEATP